MAALQSDERLGIIVLAPVMIATASSIVYVLGVITAARPLRPGITVVAQDVIAPAQAAGG